MERERLKFTPEQIKELRQNEYVKSVGDSTINYTEEFKEKFISDYKNGKNPSEILKEMGFNRDVLTPDRVKKITVRCKEYAERPEGAKDIRGKNSTGRKRIKPLTPEEEITKLKHKNLILEQENLFLKKMIFLGKKYLQKSQQE